MSLIERIKSINSDISYQQSFDMAAECARLLNDNNASMQMEAREAIIYVLEKSHFFPLETTPIWADLVETAGFYPYLQKNLDMLPTFSLADQIRSRSFQSDHLSNISFHFEQKKLSDLLNSGKNVVASAPTSFGKSLLIEELVASRKYRNIVIIQPTLALLDETRIKLKKYADIYKIIVRTTQTLGDKEKGNLFLLTAERVMEYSPFPPIDLLIIDEFYKLSLRRTDERASTLNNAFLKVMHCSNPQFYFLGPNISGITEGFAERYNAIFYKTDFSLVACNITNYAQKFSSHLSVRALDKEKLPVLFSLLDELRNQQTIVYCSSPNRARKLAREYLKHLKSTGEHPHYNLPLIDWIKNNVSDEWSLMDALKYGIAIHDGSLQKHISNSVISYFNSARLNCIFCTSTIIEGVNTSAKNVIIYDAKKGDRNIDFFDYNNICGRSGRLMEHYVGNVYNFVPIPKQEEMIVDIPFIEQDKDILTDEILVNIDKKDVKKQVKERYEDLFKIPGPLLDIIKQNGTDIHGQLSIYYALERDINTKRRLITWSQYPSYEAMTYVLSLCENNVFSFNDKHGVMSVKQLVVLLNKYREKKTIMSLVNTKKQYLLKKRKTAISAEELVAITDRAIEESFHVYRHWFQFKVPKAFRVVDSLQRYICEQKGISAGSYSFYVQQLENDFAPERLSILIEYGIPNTTILKIEKLIPKEMKDDEIVEFIKNNKETILDQLTPYERERINEEL